MKLFDSQQWEAQLGDLAARYQRAAPFPHVVLDDFINPEAAKMLEQRFPSPETGGWIQYKHVNEQKLGKNRRELLPAEFVAVIDELNSDGFVRFVERLTGIPHLIADPALEGGGLHQIQTGGFLNIHADFTIHAHHPYWRRRVNVLLYLNSGWREAWNGQLELWPADMRRCAHKIAPRLNRAVIFNTDATSFHGHPIPLATPPGITRKSIALYYYTHGAEKGKPISTNYRPRPEDSWLKAQAIALDRKLVQTYDRMKRGLGISDALASTTMGVIARLRRSAEAGASPAREAPHRCTSRS